MRWLVKMIQIQIFVSVDFLSLCIYVCAKCYMLTVVTCYEWYIRDAECVECLNGGNQDIESK